MSLIFPHLDASRLCTQVFWLTVMFITLYILNSQFLIPTIVLKIRRRSALIRRLTELAGTLLEQSRDIRKQTEQILAKAAGEAHLLKTQATHEAQQMIMAKIAEASTLLQVSLVQNEKISTEDYEILRKSLPEVVRDVKDSAIAVLLTDIQK